MLLKNILIRIFNSLHIRLVKTNLLFLKYWDLFVCYKLHYLIFLLLCSSGFTWVVWWVYWFDNLNFLPWVGLFSMFLSCLGISNFWFKNFSKDKYLQQILYLLSSYEEREVLNRAHHLHHRVNLWEFFQNIQTPALDLTERALNNDNLPNNNWQKAWSYARVKLKRFWTLCLKCSLFVIEKLLFEVITWLRAWKLSEFANLKIIRVFNRLVYFLLNKRFENTTTTQITDSLSSKKAGAKVLLSGWSEEIQARSNMVNRLFNDLIFIVVFLTYLFIWSMLIYWMVQANLFITCLVLTLSFTLWRYLVLMRFQKLLDMIQLGLMFIGQVWFLFAKPLYRIEVEFIRSYKWSWVDLGKCFSTLFLALWVFLGTILLFSWQLPVTRELCVDLAIGGSVIWIFSIISTLLVLFRESIVNLPWFLWSLKGGMVEQIKNRSGLLTLGVFASTPVVLISLLLTMVAYFLYVFKVGFMLMFSYITLTYLLYQLYGYLITNHYYKNASFIYLRKVIGAILILLGVYVFVNFLFIGVRVSSYYFWLWTIPYISFSSFCFFFWMLNVSWYSHSYKKGLKTQMRISLSAALIFSVCGVTLYYYFLDACNNSIMNSETPEIDLSNCWVYGSRLGIKQIFYLLISWLSEDWENKQWVVGFLNMPEKLTFMVRAKDVEFSLMNMYNMMDMDHKKALDNDFSIFFNNLKLTESVNRYMMQLDLHSNNVSSIDLTIPIKEGISLSDSAILFKEEAFTREMFNQIGRWSLSEKEKLLTQGLEICDENIDRYYRQMIYLNIYVLESCIKNVAAWLHKGSPYPDVKDLKLQIQSLCLLIYLKIYAKKGFKEWMPKEYSNGVEFLKQCHLRYRQCYGLREDTLSDDMVVKFWDSIALVDGGNEQCNIFEYLQSYLSVEGKDRDQLFILSLFAKEMDQYLTHWLDILNTCISGDTNSIPATDDNIEGEIVRSFDSIYSEWRPAYSYLFYNLWLLTCARYFPHQKEYLNNYLWMLMVDWEPQDDEPTFANYYQYLWGGNLHDEMGHHPSPVSYQDWSSHLDSWISSFGNRYDYITSGVDNEVWDQHLRYFRNTFLEGGKDLCWPEIKDKIDGSWRECYDRSLASDRLLNNVYAWQYDGYV